MLQHSVNGSVDIYTLTAALDRAAGSALQQAILQAVEQQRNQVVLDLSAVESADPPGLAGLVNLVRDVRASGGDMVLLNPTPGVRETLELVRLHQLFDIFDDESAAIVRLAA